MFIPFYIGLVIGWFIPVLLYRRFVGADQSRAWKTLIPFYGAFLCLKIANDPACQYDGQRFVYKDQDITMSSFINQGQTFQQDCNNMQNQWQGSSTNTQQNPMNFGQGAQNYGQGTYGNPVQLSGFEQHPQSQGYAQPDQSYNQQAYQQPAQNDMGENAGVNQGFQFNDQTWTENDFRADQ